MAVMAARADVSQVGFLGFDVFGTVVDWRAGVARAAGQGTDLQPEQAWDIVADDLVAVADMLART